MAKKIINPSVFLGKAFQKSDEIPLPQVAVKQTKPLLGPAFHSKEKTVEAVIGQPQKQMLGKAFDGYKPSAQLSAPTSKQAVNANLSPTLNSRKAELKNKIAVKIPIPGDEGFISKYNQFEKVVQEIEQNNESLQQMQLGLSLGALAGNNKFSSSLNKAGNKFAPVGKVSDILEKALWIGDAVRAVTDPEYRAEADKGMGRLVDSELEGADLFFQALDYAGRRPVAFGGAALRGLQNGINSEKQQALEELSNILDIEVSAQKENNKSRILPKGYKADDAKVTNPNKNKLDPNKNDELLLELAKKAFAEDAFYPQQSRQNYL